MPKKSVAVDTVKVLALDGSVKSELPIPAIFSSDIRPDLVKRAVLSSQSARIQPRTSDYLAGKKNTAESLGVGLDLARVPRIHGANRAAFVPNVIGGRVAFPAQLEKIYHERINNKERLVALKSAIAATANPKMVVARGHAVAEGTAFPFVVTDDLKGLKKAAEFREFLQKVSLWSDVERAKAGIKERSGRGKTRGRRWIKPKSILVVADELKPTLRLATRNFTGVEFADVNSLNVERLAPGGHAGRLTVWTESAFKRLDELYA